MRSTAKLVVVVADRAYEAVLRELFARGPGAGFGLVEAKIIPDSFHDSSGKLTELARPFLRDYDHAMVMRDLHGSGWETKGAHLLEEHLEAQLRANGWQSKQCAAIVTQPEIEEWLRLPSPAILKLLEERARKRRDRVSAFQQVLDESLKRHGGRDNRGKAKQPKEVFEELVRHYGIPPANAIRGYLAKREPIDVCLSDSFNRLLRILRLWFPAA